MKYKIRKILWLLALCIVPITTNAATGTDMNSDTCVDVSDFKIFQSMYGTVGSQADLDSSGVVDVVDLALIMQSWKPCPNTVSIVDLYPYAPNKNLRYVTYNPDGSNRNVFEIIRTEPWNDQRHFTVHHHYGNVGQDAPLCPRVDDVFEFNANNLYYLDTYNFYNPAVDGNGLTRAQIPSGQVWGRATMFKGVPVTGTIQAKTYNITETNCVTGSEVLQKSLKYQTEAEVNDATSWSPYTGGATSIVPVVMLQEKTTYTSNSKTALFVEQWYFYHDQQHGYIPIEAVILSKSLTETSLKEISRERLESIE